MTQSNSTKIRPYLHPATAPAPSDDPLSRLHGLLVSITNEAEFRALEGHLLEEIERGALDGTLIPVVANRFRREAKQPFTTKRGFSICQAMAATIAEIIRNSTRPAAA